MAQDRIKDSNENKHYTTDNFKSRVKKDKTFQTKVVIRRLPPTMNEEQFLEQISPAPDHDYFHFVKGDLRLGQHAFSRAYLNFTKNDDIFLFKEKFDGYVFLDSKGNEYPALVEFAPFQKIPKKRSKKRDAKCGTIETDVDYLNFLDSLKNPENVSLPTAEIYLEEIESREKELRANNGVPKVTTPLIEYLKQRKIEQQKIREEKREERKRKELEKKRIREEERRRRKAEKDRKEKLSQKESQPEKEVVEEVEEAIATDDAKTDAVVQVLKNPEREKEMKEHIPQKTKDFYVRHSREKDRTSKDWESERDRAKNRVRSERTVVSREKERSRREKTEYKSSYSATKTNHGETKPKGNESNDSTSTVSEVACIESEEKDEQPVSSIEKCVAKAKRDKSCPGNVETLGNSGKMNEYDSNKEFSVSLKDSCDQQMETNDESKSEGWLNDIKDQSKDPRAERRIRNKDRPSLEIYRPGMRRFSAQRNSPQKEISTSTSNSSTPSPSPTPPLTISSTKVPVKDGDKTKNRKPPFGGESNIE